MKLLPDRVKGPIRSFLRWWTAIRDRYTPRFCPVCEKRSRRFDPFGVPLRDDARCGHCGSLERHRFVWLYLWRKTDLLEGGWTSMLHVAPEPALEGRFQSIVGEGYLTADLRDDRATVKMDITEIDFPDASFDLIYCSHVLEHVEDDRKALQELYRTLKEEGWAILLVPIMGDKTFEDPSIVEPEARLVAFGQEDHVRRYGPDFVDRVREVGFEVDVIRVSEVATPREVVRMGLSNPETGVIYYCRKGTGAPS